MRAQHGDGDAAGRRVVVGLGVGGEWGAGTALVAETWPARHRGKVLAWVQSAFATGYALAALVAAVVVPLAGWRWAFFAGVLPALFALWVRRQTEEPQMWQQAKERLGPIRTERLLATAQPKALVVCLAFTSAAMCGYWGLFTWIPNYLASPVADGGRGMGILASTTWIVVMQVGAAVGFISFGYVADRIGRKLAFVAYFAAAVVSVPVFLAIDNATLMLVFGAVMALVGTGFYSGFGPTFAELFPTRSGRSPRGSSTTPAAPSARWRRPWSGSSPARSAWGWASPPPRGSTSSPVSSSCSSCPRPAAGRW